MNDIRRIILWVVFGMSCIMLWDQWQLANGRTATFFPAPAKTAPTAKPEANPGAAAAAGANSVPTVPAAPAASAAVPGQAGSAVAAAPAANIPAKEQIELTSDLLKLMVDTEGGTVVRAEMLKHSDGGAGVDHKGKNFVLLDVSKDRYYTAQTGVIGAAAYPNHKTIFTAQAGERSLKSGADAVSLVLESPEVNGVKVVKTLTLKRGSYVVDVKHEVKNLSAAAITPTLYVQLVRDGNKPPGESAFYSTFTGPAVFTPEKKFQTVDFTDIEKNSTKAAAAQKELHAKTSSDGYVAMVQHYFASAWLLGDKNVAQARDYETRKVDANMYAVSIKQTLASIAPASSLVVPARLFIGPQEEKNLEAIFPGLDLVKDYGWLTILSKPLYWLLDNLHSIFGNWGWAIVGLVALLKIAFYWLNAKAYSSMAKMKAVNPRIMEMRERMKDKPREMQQEMMKIYREEKVNPMGGCFPIMIQIPVFIALYWVLLSSVEMRNAPWIGWIKDLSSPDPWFILPVVMTGTTLLQTWLNPTPPDPMQAKLMWYMPLIFSVMFFFFPAGLVLYWLVNNILSIAQQWFINKRLGVLGK